MKEDNKLDQFGKFLVENLRDKGISHAEILLNNKSKAPSRLPLQSELNKLSDLQKDLVKKTVVESIDVAIHDFLFALQELADFDNNIKILVDDENIVQLSDGIHGESYSNDGWNAKYSHFGENI
ncbi:hypothetical protein D0817_02950 [Flavobacterium cupreum]|uniref:Uncharacterized protein n=1 Tax=Flavobacterium cupreum TaxID=2133766 RepID=A0A434ABD2_9FLAO|nr:hypothetical protein [Flavobacterium cupreum]RUT71657.1 hypothetical protein D0817_02950 [Flavobacterium cupreum]